METGYEVKMEKAGWKLRQCKYNYIKKTAAPTHTFTCMEDLRDVHQRSAFG